MPDADLGRKQLLLLAVLFEGGMGLAAVALGWFFDLPFWEGLAWDLHDAALGTATALPMLLLFFACVRWPIGPLKSIRDFTDQVIQPLFRTCSVLDLVLICLLAGFGEEAFFRGFLQAILERTWDEPWLAIGLSSLLFGIMHPITRTYALLAAGVSIYLGIIFYLSGKLLVVMIAHAIYDFVALLYLSRRRGRAAHEQT